MGLQQESQKDSGAQGSARVSKTATNVEAGSAPLSTPQSLSSETQHLSFPPLAKEQVSASFSTPPPSAKDPSAGVDPRRHREAEIIKFIDSEVTRHFSDPSAPIGNSINDRLFVEKLVREGIAQYGETFVDQLACKLLPAKARGGLSFVLSTYESTGNSLNSSSAWGALSLALGYARLQTKDPHHAHLLGAFADGFSAIAESITQGDLLRRGALPTTSLFEAKTKSGTLGIGVYTDSKLSQVGGYLTFKKRL